MTTSQRQLSSTLVWAVVTACLVLVIQAVGIQQAFGDDGEPAVAGIAAEYPLAGPEALEGDDLQALYGGLTWSVVDTRITPAEGLLGRARVELDLAVTNILNLTDVRVSDAMLALVSDAGETATDTSFQNQGTRLSIGPGDTADVTVAFVVGFHPDPDPATLSLRVAEPGRLPLLIPLGGQDASPTEQPFFAAVDTVGRALVDPDDPARRIVIAPIGARVDVNAGPLRAPDGQRLVVVKLDLQRAVRNDAAPYLTAPWWTLDTSVGPVPPLLVAPQPDGVGDNPNEVTLVFAYPADAVDLVVVADPTGEAARIPIVLPQVD